MLPQDQRPKVTLEDLLQLKRAERPGEDFWTNFDRELRQKQLTALMEKRSWWHSLPRLFSSKAYFPVGATAILAFTLVSIKFYAPNDSSALDEGVLSVAAGAAPAAAGNSATVDLSEFPIAVPAVQEAQLAQAEPRAASAVNAVEVPASANARVEVPMLAADAPIDTPSARSIAANLARLQQSEPELLESVLGPRLSPEARVQTASATTPEFANLDTGGAKRARLLVQYSDQITQDEPSAPSVMRDRMSRRLADNEFNDRFTRVGVRGDQVSLRF